MAYAVYSFGSQYHETGQIGLYVGTRADNLRECLAIAAAELTDVAAGNLRPGELDRAKENLKGRLLLSLESTSARMTRLGKALVTDVPIVPVDETVQRIEAVTAEDVAGIAAELLVPSRLSAAGIGPDADLFHDALAEREPRAAREVGVRVALFGYRGRVGSTLVPALEEAGWQVHGIEVGDDPIVAGCDVAVDFTLPESAAGNALASLDQGVPPIVGTSGIATDALEALDALGREQGVPALVVPNFALGAVLMMRFAETASAWLSSAEIVELHHDGKLDAPSGTAKATAARMQSVSGREIPIHSVRLPGLVAHQEVILGGRGETLTIRHDSHSRDSFVPGVLLALDRIGTLPAGLTVGLDALL